VDGLKDILAADVGVCCAGSEEAKEHRKEEAKRRRG
jgi:hypothetical protein